MNATAIVDWEALGQVVAYSVVLGIGLPAIMALSIRAAARSSSPRSRGLDATFYAAIAVLGALACIAAVAFGIWVMVDK